MICVSQDTAIRPTWVHKELLSQAAMTQALGAGALLPQEGARHHPPPNPFSSPGAEAATWAAYPKLCATQTLPGRDLCLQLPYPSVPPGPSSHPSSLSDPSPMHPPLPFSSISHTLGRQNFPLPALQTCPFWCCKGSHFSSELSTGCCLIASTRSQQLEQR